MWNIFFESIKKKEYIKKLKLFLNYEYKNYVIFPERKYIFNAFSLVEPQNIKVVILGQDPYCNKNQATGLAFSVKKNINMPPSLINIFKEIENEFHIKMAKNGDLTYLAKQGCFLFNTILTVREKEPLSHNIYEYKKFTIDVLKYIDSLEQFIVFMLWGKKAQQFKKYICNSKRLILLSGHPSPLSASRGLWFGNNHFKKANNFFKINNIKEINWKNV